MKHIRAYIWYLWKIRPRIVFVDKIRRGWRWKLAKMKYKINKKRKVDFTCEICGKIKVKEVGNRDVIYNTIIICDECLKNNDWQFRG